MWYISHSILLKPKLLWRSAPRDAFNVVNNGTSAYTTVDEKDPKWDYGLPENKWRMNE